MFAPKTKKNKKNTQLFQKNDDNKVGGEQTICGIHGSLVTNAASGGDMGKCFFDRNDEIVQRILPLCSETPINYSKNGDRAECTVKENPDGSTRIRLDYFSNGARPVRIEATTVRNQVGPYLPSRTQFRMFMGNSRSAKGNNPVKFSNIRICEDASQFSTFKRALDTFLGKPFEVGNLPDSYLRAESETIESMSELSGVPPEVQDIYPTSIVDQAATGFEYETSIEGMMVQFRDIKKQIKEYQNTPFMARKVNPADLYVCRRSAHEVFGLKFAFGCGDYATAFLAILQLGGIQSRLVKAVNADFSDKNDAGHDLVEIFDEKEKRWVLTDPSTSRVYRKYNGEKHFSIGTKNYIRMGEWESSWQSSCYSKTDLRKMRERTIRQEPLSDIPSVDITEWAPLTVF